MREASVNRTVSALAVVLVLAAARAAGAQSAAPPDTTPHVPAPSAAPASPTISPPKLTGYMQARATVEKEIGLTATLNRVRFGAEGSLPNRFAYRVMVEYEASGNARTAAGVSLRDAYIRWTRDGLAVQAGQFKTPFSRNFVTSLSLLETVDRPAVVDTLATKRDIGVMAEYLPRPEASLSLGVFNGEGQNLPANRDSTVLFVSRAVLRPMAQLSVGASGAAYESDSTRWGFEASYEEHGAIVRGEWIAQHRRSHGPNDEGWFVLGAMRVVPWVQLVVMQEDLIRSYIGPAARNRATTVGANLDLGAGRTRLTVEYVARRSGPAQTSRRQGIAQLQVRF
jgi:phosphate-selective porin